MQTCIDEVVCWSKMIFSVTTVDEREIFQMGIIIEGKIVEHNDTEKLQNFLIAIPISCCVIIPLYCDFDARLTINLQRQSKNRNKIVFSTSNYSKNYLIGIKSQYSAISD